MRFAMMNRLMAALALAALVSAAGCSDPRSKLGTVSGKVTYKRGPVTGGTIMFYSVDGNIAPYPGQIKADGTFFCADVPPGMMKVVIETESVKNDPRGKPLLPEMPEGMKDSIKDLGKYPKVEGGARTKYRQIPEKYGSLESTPLKIEVRAGEEITKEFVLKD
jgi:hypothetical protein